MPALATLLLNGHGYDVKLSGQNFNVPTGWNGFPRQSLMEDGQLHILMDTPGDNFILELMLKTEEPLAEGCLEIYDSTVDLPIRHIQFSKAFITAYRETFDILNGGGMTTYVRISPMEMTINKEVKMERRFFWLWNRVIEEPMEMPEIVADEDVRINDAYWIDPDGTKCRDFPLDEPVKLYLKIANHNAGQTLQFDFEEETEEGIFHASCSGQVDDQGIVIVEDFKLKKKG